MFQGGWAGLLAGALAGLAGPAGAVVVIDSFDTQQILLMPTGGVDMAFLAAAAPEALGGERDLEILRLNGNDAVELLVHPPGGDPQLFCSSAAATIATWRVVWDGPDGGVGIDADGLGGIDLTQGGVNTGFSLRLQSDLAANVEIAVTGASGGSTAASLPIAPGGSLEDRFLPFTAFAAPALFADAGSVSLTLSGGAGLDAQVDQLRVTAPEPAGAGAALVALLALVCRYRHTARPRG